jgi:hypothetical protein
MELKDGEVEIQLGDGESVKVAPIFVSAEATVEGGDSPVWEFEIPEGVEPMRVVMILAELR